MCEKFRVWISKRRPWVFENSRLPIWLSKFAPIEVWAFSIGPVVCCRGVMNDNTRRHECIHYHQQLEMLFIGQWICYGLFWLKGLWTYRKHADRGAKAYRENPFEREAYDKQDVEDYFSHRKLYSWTKYIGY